MLYSNLSYQNVTAINASCVLLINSNSHTFLQRIFRNKRTYSKQVTVNDVQHFQGKGKPGIDDFMACFQRFYGHPL